jgi:predicted ATPase
MIKYLDIKDPTSTHIKWLGTVPALSKPRKFEFTPGLNILWGKNGSGKSTLIQAMATMLHCFQGGSTTVTRTSIDDSLGSAFDKRKGKLTDSIELCHDGQCARMFDPSKAVGLIGGSFDDDFFHMGVQNAMFKGSSGQTNMMRFDGIIRDIMDDKVPDIVSKISEGNANDLWAERIKEAKKLLEGSCEKGPPTVFLDEPDRSLDLQNQVLVWRFIRAVSHKVQFIVAAHSLFALKIPEANYIELDTGYLEISRHCGKILDGFDKEPMPVLNAKAVTKKKK